MSGRPNQRSQPQRNAYPLRMASYTARVNMEALAASQASAAMSTQEDQMAETAILICPKCRGEMRTYERNGIVIDQCEECRGIFLDRGELEQLLDAERGSERDEDRHDNRHRRYHHDDDDRDRDDHDESDGRRGRGRRRTSATQFLSDFLGGGE